MKEKQIRVRLPLIVYVDGLIFYDAQNQLLSETIGSDTTSYTYDTAGNIRSVTGPSVSKSFSYNDSGDWKDLLTSVTVNGTTRSITYEEENGVTIGNPLSYFNGTQYTLAWQNGRQLASLSGGGKSATYTYGADGIRTGKTVTDASGTTTYQYTTQNGQIARQSWSAGGTAYQMDFIYDATGRPLAMYYRSKTASQADFNGDSYYYETNQQGDVTGLYKITYNATTKALSATRVASYEYDAWGNVTYSTGTMAKLNPLKYRGYYHDAESGFYYLQSRYYDPAIGRFINADKPELVDFNFSKNLFVYSGNNPTTLKDNEGTFAITAAVILTGVFCGLLSGGVSASVTAATGGDTTNIALSFASGFVSGAVLTIFPCTAALVGTAVLSGALSTASDIHTQKKAGKDVNIGRSLLKGGGSAICSFASGSWGKALTDMISTSLAGSIFSDEISFAISAIVGRTTGAVLDYGTGSAVDRLYQNSYNIPAGPSQSFIDSLNTFDGNRGHTYHGYTY